jgi:hypothetical protein
MVDRASRADEALEHVVEAGRLLVENGAARSNEESLALTHAAEEVAPPAPAERDPAQGLLVKRFGARLHLLIEVPSIRRAVLIFRADVTAVRKWIIRALMRSPRQP